MQASRTQIGLCFRKRHDSGACDSRDLKDTLWFLHGFSVMEGIGTESEDWEGDFRVEGKGKVSCSFGE